MREQQQWKPFFRVRVKFVPEIMDMALLSCDTVPTTHYALAYETPLLLSRERGREAASAALD
jgi:hypothetical protein